MVKTKRPLPTSHPAHPLGSAVDRLEMVRQSVNEILRQQPNEETRRWGFVHLYGVAATCALLATRRGLDAQLCAVAGMLHDIWSYKTGDPTDHARLGAPEAERILKATGRFASEEIRIVCGAISRHNDKDACDGEMDELLKDADVLQHCLHNPALMIKLCGLRREYPPETAPRARRMKRVFDELGLGEVLGPTTDLLDCVAFMLIKGDSVLAERRKLTKKADPGAVALPGGHMKRGESCEEALRRESREELGIIPRDIAYVCSLLHRSPELHKIHYFAVHSWEGELENNEAEALLWIPVSELERLDLDIDRVVIGEYLRVCAGIGMAPVRSSHGPACPLGSRR